MSVVRGYKEMRKCNVVECSLDFLKEPKEKESNKGEKVR